MNKQDIVKQILAEAAGQPKDKGAAYAPVNIALCKYWGKRDTELNLPRTSSLSLSLGPNGAHTEVSLCSDRDAVELNGQALSPDDPVTVRVIDYLELFRPDPATRFHVITRSNVPLGAGLASSAAGFAALVLALNDLLGWDLGPSSLSILARLGSGSACRSIYTGFVHWHAGARQDGMDSFAEPLPVKWPGLRLGLLVLSDEQKPIGSRAAMKRTTETSDLYSAWPAKADKDMALLMQAISEKDFPLLGAAAESNALAMHATMICSTPPVLYWKPETVIAMHRIWELREQGLPLYFTMDAGPNMKLLFLDENTPAVTEAFPDMQLVNPFPA